MSDSAIMRQSRIIAGEKGVCRDLMGWTRLVEVSW